MHVDLHRIANLARIASKEVMYHGTSSQFLKTILSQGVRPNPGKRVWDQGWQESYEGSYWTGDIRTATDSAWYAVGAFPGNPLFVVAQIETRSSLVDEDLILPANLIMRKVFQKIGGGVAVDREDYYSAAKEEVVELFVGEYLQELFRNIPQIDRKKYSRTTAQVSPLIREYGSWYFDWLGDQFERGKRGFPMMKEDPIKETRAFTDKIICKLRGVLPTLMKGEMQYNLRVTEPVTYRGANRILSVVEDLPDEVKIHYGEPPQELLDYLQKKPKVSLHFGASLY